MPLPIGLVSGLFLIDLITSSSLRRAQDRECRRREQAYLCLDRRRTSPYWLHTFKPMTIGCDQTLKLTKFTRQTTTDNKRIMRVERVNLKVSTLIHKFLQWCAMMHFLKGRPKQIMSHANAEFEHETAENPLAARAWLGTKYDAGQSRYEVR